MTPQQHQQYHQVTAAVANQQQQNQNTISNQAPAQGIQTANSLPLMVSCNIATDCESGKS